MLQYQLTDYRLYFRFRAGTSRGFLEEKQSYFICLKHTESQKQGLGEVSLIDGLSPDAMPDFQSSAQRYLQQLCNQTFQTLDQALEWHYQHCQPQLPALRFGVEVALRSLWAETDPMLLYPSAFTEGKQGIPINGLIWMGKPQAMQQQIEEKLAQGFRCIKMKIGALNIDTELKLLRLLRQRFPASYLEIRVDANGAFSPADAPKWLDQLAKLDIHSIEQPIAPGQWDTLARLCRNSPIPIALDEELIGIYTPHKQQELLSHVRPQYIILKPSLLGGIAACQQWIHLAETYNIGWWITSALEANIGLNAIAQWTATLKPNIPQGLGTGQLYQNNIASPLCIRGDTLYYCQNEQKWDLSCF